MAEAGSGSVGTAQLQNGAVTDAKVNVAAAIAYSKLALNNSILTSDILSTEFNMANKLLKLDASALVPLARLGGITNTQIAAAAAIAKTKLANLDIVNADVNAAAAIADSKISPVPSTALTTHAALSASVHGVGASGFEDKANKNVNNGYAGLDLNALLALAQQRLNFKMSYFTRNTALSGNQVITGVGFTPRMVILIGAVPTNPGEAGICFYDGTENHSLYNTHQSTANAWNATYTIGITFIQSPTIYCQGAVASLDADGFTIAWTVTGAKTGAAAMHYIAFR